MMPLAPTPVMAMPMSKPKIGFSIDAIVGNRTNKNSGNYSPNGETPDRPLTPLSDCGYPNDFTNLMNNSRVRSPDDGQIRLSEASIAEFQHRINRYAHEISTDINKNQNIQTRTDTINKSPPPAQQTPPPPTQSRLTPDESKHRTPPPQQQKGPIIVPGIPAGLVRPFPVPPHGMSDIKQLPPYMNANDMMSAAHNQHFLAAQFQAAAALAHAGQGFPPGGLPPHAQHLHNPNMVRESYPLYPWLLSRHGRIFPHRFPGSEYKFLFLFNNNAVGILLKSV
jgi:homeobox protein EMX